MMICLLLGGVMLKTSAQLPDARQIMEKCRDLTLTSSLRADIELTITERNGSTRNRKITMTSKSYPDDLEKRLIKFLEPADVRGTGMLILDNKDEDDEMWIYLPALKRTRRIVSNEKGKSFMSSEFTNADMTSSPLSDFRIRHLPGSGENNQWIIESTPISDDKADEYGYSRKVSFVDMADYHFKKIEFYNYDNELFRTMETKSIHPLPDGKFIYKNMIAANKMNNRSSEILYTEISAGISIDDSFFTVQNLER